MANKWELIETKKTLDEINENSTIIYDDLFNDFLENLIYDDFEKVKSKYYGKTIITTGKDAKIIVFAENGLYIGDYSNFSVSMKLDEFHFKNTKDKKEYEKDIAECLTPFLTFQAYNGDSTRNDFYGDYLDELFTNVALNVSPIYPNIFNTLDSRKALKEERGDSPLLSAIWASNFNLANYIIQVRESFPAIVNLNIKDAIGGKTALMSATLKGYDDIAKKLINLSDLSVIDNKGRNALYYTLLTGNDDIAIFFIEKIKSLNKGASEEVKNRNEKIVNNEGVVLLQNILNGKIGINISTKDLFNLKDDVEMLKFIIKDNMFESIDQNHVKNIEKRIEQLNNFISIKENEVQNFTDINDKDASGKTALMNAIIKGYDNIAANLVSVSDLTIVDNKGRNALYYALLSENYEIVSMIMNRVEAEKIDIYNNEIKELSYFLSLGEEQNIFKEDKINDLREEANMPRAISDFKEHTVNFKKVEKRLNALKSKNNKKAAKTTKATKTVKTTKTVATKTVSAKTTDKKDGESLDKSKKQTKTSKTKEDNKVRTQKGSISKTVDGKSSNDSKKSKAQAKTVETKKANKTKTSKTANAKTASKKNNDLNKSKEQLEALKAGNSKMSKKTNNKDKALGSNI